ncbi:hypothetical protein PybrP1_005285 [[Pythium] brassicae (nom. inval.)]|nr:hypothetical protein PybrP1_005285 [[Pythium] brassicae (nom. inval.)]
MAPVRVIHARVQSDEPHWEPEYGTFVSAYGSTFAERYRAVFDTVNTASVEGALMYVQAEGINVRTNPECKRKNNMQYIVFYELRVLQPEAALTAEFCADTGGQYGGVEFSASEDNSAGSVTAIPFWEQPFERDACRWRVRRMVEFYNNRTASATNMTPLPLPAALSVENPPCYRNSARCAAAPFGCKREHYSQVCRVCAQEEDGCVKASYTLN